MKFFVFAVVLLSVASCVFAASSALESRLDAKMNLLVGQSIPSQYDLLAEDGKFVVKFVNLPNIPDHVINFLDDVQFPNDLKYSVQVKDHKVQSVSKGATTGYVMLIAINDAAATRILDSQNPTQQIKSEIIASNVRYRAYGYFDAKLQFLKTVASFLAVFSKDVASAMPFLAGLK